MTYLIGEMKNLWHLLKVICPRSIHHERKTEVAENEEEKERGNEKEKER